MIHTIIICLSIVLIVALICYTCYKTHTYKANFDILDTINSKLSRLNSNCDFNDSLLNNIWDNIQEIKSYLREQNEKSINKGTNSNIDTLGY